MTFELWDHTFKDLFSRGGGLMWPLLACSVVAVALMLDRAVAHARIMLDYRRFVAQLQKMVTGGQTVQALDFCGKSRHPVARTAEAYLQNLELPDEARATVVEREGSQALEEVEKRQRGLSAVAHIATLTGLLGTVAGLVEAFHQIELAGGQVEPSDLAAGIWAALLTTVFGLAIAIPSYVAFHIFESRSDRAARQMGYIVSYLDQWLHKRTVGHPSTPDEHPPAAGFREE